MTFRPGQKNMPNRITVVSLEWRGWLAWGRGPTAIGDRKTAPTNTGLKGSGGAAERLGLPRGRDRIRQRALMSVDDAEIRQVIGGRDGCFRRVDGAINLQLSAMRRALRRDGRPTHSSRERQLSVQCLRKCDVAVEHGFAPRLSFSP